MEVPVCTEVQAEIVNVQAEPQLAVAQKSALEAVRRASLALSAAEDAARRAKDEVELEAARRAKEEAELQLALALSAAEEATRRAKAEAERQRLMENIAATRIKVRALASR